MKIVRRIILIVLFSVPPLLIAIAVIKAGRNAKQADAVIEKQAIDEMLGAITRWQQLAVIPVADLDFRAFNDSLVVDSTGTLPSKDMLESLKRTVFKLCHALAATEANEFLDFWEPYKWTINEDFGSYLFELAGTDEKNQTNIVRLAWKKVVQKNRITHISLGAMKAEVSWTSDVGKLVAEKFRNDISDLSSTSFAPNSGILLSRSVFDSKPLSSEIIAKDGKVLYARVVLIVRYPVPFNQGQDIALPLAMGFYWSPELNLWVPHVKGSTSAVDKYGCLF